MRILAIDCSTEVLSLAVGDASEASQRRGHAGQAHSRLALAWIEDILASQRREVADLHGIAFGAGPGAFTGVRIACGIAQGLALGAGLPVVAVPTLEALAHRARVVHGVSRVLACLDARMNEVYVAAYEHVGNRLTTALAPAVMKASDVAPPAGEWFGAGGGFAAYPELAALPQVRGVDPTIEPEATSIIALAVPRFEAGEGVDAAHALPLYVRHRVALTTAERAAGARL